MKNYKNHFREDATILGETMLLPILLILLFLGTMWAMDNKTHAEFDLKYNPPKGQVLKFEPQIELKAPDPLPYIKNGGYKNEKIAYAWSISKDKDFVLTMNAECGSWNCYTHALKYKRDGELWSDGFQCGISAYYHTDKFVKAKELHHKGHWKSILDICYDLYKGGTRFYGYDHRIERGRHIIFN